MPTNISLNKAAELLKAHPRTVLRALTGEENPYWAKDEDQEVDEDKLCRALSIEKKVWNNVKSNRDAFLTRDEVMKAHEIGRTTFKRRGYPVAAKMNRLRRYSEVEVNNYRITHYGRDLDPELRAII